MYVACMSHVCMYVVSQVRGPGRHGDELAYHLFSLAPIPRGHELCISYGDLSAASALVGYGFTLNDIDNTCMREGGAEAGGKMATAFQLALPVVPEMSKRGRLSYGYQLFDFDRACLDEGVEEMLTAGVSRVVLTRAVKRRVKLVNSMLDELQKEEVNGIGNDEDIEGTELSTMQQHHNTKRIILHSELSDLKALDSFLDNYEQFLLRKSTILQERSQHQIDHCKEVMGYAHLFREQTGLDIAPELFDDEDMSTLLL
jgi:hypothetical protein